MFFQKSKIYLARELNLNQEILTAMNFQFEKGLNLF
jgi:hypothetical protein